MPRRIVPLVTGETYHVYNRGVDKRVVFLDNEDYLRFYESLHYFNSTDPAISFFECARKVRMGKLNSDDDTLLVHIHAYTLLPNHYHLMLTQVADGGLSEFKKRVIGGYTSYFNEKYERSGALFQGTFKRSHIKSNEQFLFLASYVNFNHAVHGLPQTHEIFKTSRDVLEGLKSSPFLKHELITSQFTSPNSFMQSALSLTKEINELRTKVKEDNRRQLILE